MNHLVECDQQLTQRNNFKKVNEFEMTRNFIERTSSLPIVHGTTFYVSLTYNTVKDKNVIVGSFIGSIENFVLKAATIAIDISQKVVSSNYLDKLACKGLDKMEYNVPLITKNWDEVLKDSREYILKKISGVTDPAEIPSTVVEAFGKRKQYLELWMSETLRNNRASRTIISSLNKILDKTESVLDFVFPKHDHDNCPQEVGTDSAVLQRIICIAGKAKRRFLALSREVNEEETGDKITVKDAMVTNRWLLQYYQKLQHLPEGEGIVSKAFRLSALSAVGTILTFNGIVAATWPRTVNYVSSVADFLKKFVARVIIPIKNRLDSVHPKSLGLFINITYEEFLTYVSKVYQNFPERISKMANSVLDYLKNLNQYVKGTLSKVLKETEDGSLVTDVRADSTTMTNGPN